MSDPIATIERYFDRLAAAFADSDPAVAQDAMYDAQEFLAAERESKEGTDPADEADLVAQLMLRFGEPQEVVESYTATESRVVAALAGPRPRTAPGVLSRVLGVFTDPYSYGALLFMLLSLPVGILYFTWAITGLSLSVGLAVLIFGFLFFLFFMSTVRAAALVECRVVEALLGVRMPRRPAFVPPRGRWTERVKFWITDERTWLTILYMILRLPLGVVYFVVTVLFLAFALSFLLAPFVQLFLDYPIIQILDNRFYLPFWFFPVLWLAGALDLLILMHISRLVGRFHASLAKSMLARPGI